MFAIILKVIKQMLLTLTSASIVSILMTAAPEIQSKRTDKFDKYRNEYIRIGEQFEVPIDFREKAKAVKFYESKLADKVAGECNYFFNEITINKKHWKYLGPTHREELIFHEMQHCVMTEFGHRKKGIMRAEGFYSPEVYKRNYQTLINDLFKCSKKSLNCVEIKWDNKKYLDK